MVTTIVETSVGGSAIAIENPGFEISQLPENQNATETEPFLGKDLGIRLVNLLADSGEDVEFDNVRLFAQTVEPVLPTLSLNTQPTNVN